MIHLKDFALVSPDIQSGDVLQAVGDWVKSHQHIVDDHNNKYGLGQYHNKRHRGIEITDKVTLWGKE